MGQYYKPCILDEDGKIVAYGHAHKYRCGIKLTEHSWLPNEFVARIASEILETSKHIVWAGDYTEPEDGNDDNLYALCNNAPELPYAESEIDYTVYQFLVNHSKREYVDISKLPEADGWIYHPLPLLTAEGNGQGGGDYWGPDESKVGLWARDLISLEKSIPADFQEFEVAFIDK